MGSELFGAGGEGGCKHPYKTRMERSPHIPHPCVLRRPCCPWLGCPCCPQAPALDGGQQEPLIPCHHPRPCPHPCWDARRSPNATVRPQRGAGATPCGHRSARGWGRFLWPLATRPSSFCSQTLLEVPPEGPGPELSPLGLWCGARCGHLPMAPGHDQGSPGAKLSPWMPQLG